MTDIWYSIEVSKIPASTKLIPAYAMNKFSLDGSRILLGGYKNGVINRSDETINRWLRDTPPLDRSSLIDDIMSTAIAYTKEQYFIEVAQPDSDWYCAPTDDENG